MQLNVVFQPCLRRILSPRGVLAFVCVMPPAVAALSVMHVMEMIEISPARPAQTIASRSVTAATLSAISEP